MVASTLLAAGMVAAGCLGFCIGMATASARAARGYYEVIRSLLAACARYQMTVLELTEKISRAEPETEKPWNLPEPGNERP